MKTIRISFEYNTYFLWLLENDILIDAVRVNSCGYFEGSGWPEKGIPYKQYPEERLLGKKDLEKKVDYLNEKYPELFIDNEIEFSYKGFDNEEECFDFIKTFQEFYEEFYELLKDKYEIINEVTNEDF